MHVSPPISMGISFELNEMATQKTQDNFINFLYFHLVTLPDVTHSNVFSINDLVQPFINQLSVHLHSVVNTRILQNIRSPTRV